MFTLTWTYSCLQTLRQFAAFWVVSTPNMYLVVPPGPYHLKKTEPAANMDLLIFRWHFSCQTNVDTVVQNHENKRRYCQDQRFLDILACWRECKTSSSISEFCGLNQTAKSSHRFLCCAWKRAATLHQCKTWLTHYAIKWNFQFHLSSWCMATFPSSKINLYGLQSVMFTILLEPHFSCYRNF